ncbi:MAG: hypothetical protein NXH72_05015 [Hyphomonadaceae bacterium]|nr:hypothetical protein [Hyphomonadaceae bacterium]
MLEFLIEDPRARFLAGFALVLIIIGTLYRVFLVPRPISMRRAIVLQGLVFKEVGPESPEQYDVYFGDHMVGYVRYRFGQLSAEYPDVGMETVFNRTLKHETGQMTDEERGRWLPVIAKRLRKRLASEA